MNSRMSNWYFKLGWAMPHSEKRKTKNEKQKMKNEKRKIKTKKEKGKRKNEKSKIKNKNKKLKTEKKWKTKNHRSPTYHDIHTVSASSSWLEIIVYSFKKKVFFLKFYLSLA